MTRKPVPIKPSQSATSAEMGSWVVRCEVTDHPNPHWKRQAVVFGRHLDSGSARQLADWLVRFADWSDEHFEAESKNGV